MAFAATVASSSGAWPGPPMFGRSVGSPTDGHLLGGAHLQESTCLRYCPVYGNSDVRWGLEALVGLIDRGSRAVRKQYPDAVLTVGHLSRAGGGEIDHHRSHESGRDADVLFYIKGITGKPLLAEQFVAFKPDGTAPTWPGALFDDARNWAFIASLVTDPKVKVAHVFVASPLRARLLAYAEKSGAPATVRMRAAEVMAQPHGSLPHDDHFHVRIACPSGMAGCIEYPTIARVRSRGRGAPSVAGARSRGRDVTRPAPARSPATKPLAPKPTKPRTSAAPSPSNEVTGDLPGDAPLPSFAPTRPMAGVPGVEDETLGAPSVVAPARIDDVDDVDGDGDGDSPRRR